MNPVPPVIHLVISLAAGGLERLVVNWTNARNHTRPGSTTICCLDRPGEFADQVQGGRVVVLNADRSRRPFDVHAVLRLRALLRHQEGVVLHSHNAAAWQYGVLGCLGQRVRHIHSEHGSNPHKAGVANRIRNACLWRLTDKVVAVAESTAQDLARKQGIPVSRIRVVPNGVAASVPRDSPGRHGGRPSIVEEEPIAGGSGSVPTARMIIGSVGRLAHVKGYDRLIHAFAQLATPSASLILVGEGPEREALEALAASLGIAARVIFAGYQSEPGLYLGAMDLFVLPSRSEGVSLSLLEAMAAGVPVAATDVGANREVLDDGRCGLLLPDDEAAWADLLTSALSDPQGAALRCRAAAARVKARYSLGATLGAYEGLYADAAGTGK